MAIVFTDNLYVFTLGAVGVTAAGTTTSRPQDVSKRENVTLVFTASDISSGNGVFSVDASNDNSYWATGIAFQSAAMVGVSTTPGVKSLTLSTNRNWGAILNPVGWQYIRVKVVKTTDGRYNCVLHSQG